MVAERKRTAGNVERSDTMVSTHVVSSRAVTQGSMASRILRAFSSAVGWAKFFLVTFANAREQIYKIAGDRFVCWED